MPVVNENSVDPDQTPRSAASDLGLHCCLRPIYGTLGSTGLTITTLLADSVGDILMTFFLPFFFKKKIDFDI